MLQKTKQGFYLLRGLARINGLVHGFSSVDFGNMSFVHGPKDQVLSNRVRFALAIGVEPRQLASVFQEHGSKIWLVKKADQTEKIGADGLITQRKKIGLLIKTADCLPIIIVDPQKVAIGLVHAGRKGIDYQVHLEAIRAMETHFGSRPQHLLVGFGPAICSRCYHGKINLLEMVMADFKKIGVQKEKMETAGICTFENRDFYSHQRSRLTGEPEARLAVLLSWR